MNSDDERDMSEETAEYDHLQIECACSGGLNLNEVIGILKLARSLYGEDHLAKEGFAHPHSYRGYYLELAFSISNGDKTLGAMLAMAKGCLGEMFTGYKGGEFVMGSITPVHIAAYGNCSDDSALTGKRLYEMITGESVQPLIDKIAEGQEQ